MAQARVLEQPAREIRYRYKSERRARARDEGAEKGRSGVGILGASTTTEKRTYPSIVIEGYRGFADIRVSCVCDVDEYGKYRPHPHELVGSDCKKGGYFQKWVEVTSDPFVQEFNKIAIRCVRKRDIREALEDRAKYGFDPFQTGISHAGTPNDINLGAVRLCIQVSVHEDGRLRHLQPLVSDVIQDTKKLSKLKISYCSHTSAPVTGGDIKLVLLCDKIFTKDVNVVFFETGKDGARDWEVSVRSEFIFQHVAVVVKVPPFRDRVSLTDHDVSIELWDPTDGSRSTQAHPFKYTSLHTDPKYRPPEHTGDTAFETKYGQIVARKRTKPRYWIPPELFDIPNTYNFQQSSFPQADGAGGPSTTGTHQAIVERFHSVPGPSQEGKPLKREASCPDSYFARYSYDTTAMPSISTNAQNPSIESNAGYVDQAYTDNGLFLNPSPCIDMKMESINPATPNSVCSNVDYTPIESIEMFDSPALDVRNQIFNPGSSSQSVFPTVNMNLPNSPSMAPCQRLPSIVEVFPQLSTTQNDNIQVLEDTFPEFVNSPNIPNFEDIM